MLKSMCAVFLVLDVDECKPDNGMCEQECFNFRGGFDCRCYVGYRYDPVNRRCVGIYTYTQDCSVFTANFLDVTLS